MKKNVLFMFLLIITVILQAQSIDAFREEGIASWYGREFEGRPTASGEIFDASQLTAAHPNLPFGTVIVVTNTHNNKSVTVRVNDCGPFVPARIVDVSRAAAEQLDMIVTGTAPVKIEVIDRVVLSAPVIGAQMEIETNVNINSSVVSISETHDIEAVITVPVIATSTVITNNHSDIIIRSSPEIVVLPPAPVRIIPDVNIEPGRIYRLQVGSFRNARNAVDAFERLTNAGLNPAYERFIDGENNDYYRVVLAGVAGSDVRATAEKLGVAGFREALIRIEN